MTVWQLLAASAIVSVGALLQGTVGFGLGLFAAPLLLLIDPRLVPGPMLCASGLLTLLLARRDWHGVRGDDLRWSVGGRLVGTVPAVLVMALLPGDLLDLLFGALVLVGVALTATGWHPRPAPGTLVGAGFLSGFMGTTTSIGGPPMALLYSGESGPRLRGTLSAFFVVGVLISVPALAVVGRFGRTELTLGAMLSPGIVLGYLASKRPAAALDRRPLRPAVLGVATLAGLAVIAKNLLG